MGQLEVTLLTVKQVHDQLKMLPNARLKSHKGKKYILFGKQKYVNDDFADFLV